MSVIGPEEDKFDKRLINAPTTPTIASDSSSDDVNHPSSLSIVAAVDCPSKSAGVNTCPKNVHLALEGSVGPSTASSWQTSLIDV